MIDSVRVFGSRAMGNYSDYSDLDLVIDGSIELDQVDRLVTLFDESNLGLSVDVKGYLSYLIATKNSLTLFF